MRLHELMILHQDEFIAACRAKINDGDGLGTWARYAAEHFDDIVHLLQKDSAPSPALTNESPATDGQMLGTDAEIARARFGIDQLSRRSRAPVLFVGEFGAGKRHAARALHTATYPDGEFFELDSAARLDELERRLNALRTCTSAESTAGLSVYVHELSEVQVSVQLRVSQLLHEQSLRFRLVTSSSRALSQAAREGLLRSDLVFRFPTVIELPPLRDRLEDLPLLTRHFSALIAARQGGTPTSFEASAFERMAEHDWPGNLTELCNFVVRVRREFGSARVGREELPELGERQSGVLVCLPRSGIDFAELERELLTQALVMAENNQTRAASLLGLTRDQLRYRLGKFDIALPRTRSG
jgi:DNA-binding NtrC family response regulator